MTYKLSPRQIATAVKRMAGFLYDYCRQNDKHYLVTGVSGGLDSAVVLALADRACQLANADGFRLTSIGLLLPCHSDPEHTRLGRLAIEKFAAQELMVELDEIFTAIEQSVSPKTEARIREILHSTNGESELDSLAWSKRVAQGNIKARLRMLCGTYHIARLVNGLVISTDNYSELLMGFWTINGDVGDLGPIQYIFKGLELYDIARFLGVPEEIVKAAPTDGLGITAGGDEAQLGADYETVDKIMINLLQNGFDPDGSLSQLDNLVNSETFASDTVYKLAERTLKAAYKRSGPKFPNRQELKLPALNEMEI